MILSNGNLLQRGSIQSWAHAVLPQARTTKVAKAALEALRFMSNPFSFRGILTAVDDPLAVQEP
jgi:hypothetical protein